MRACQNVLHYQNRRMILNALSASFDWCYLRTESEELGYISDSELLDVIPTDSMAIVEEASEPSVVQADDEMVFDIVNEDSVGAGTQEGNEGVKASPKVDQKAQIDFGDDLFDSDEDDGPTLLILLTITLVQS